MDTYIHKYIIKVIDLETRIKKQYKSQTWMQDGDRMGKETSVRERERQREKERRVLWAGMMSPWLCSIGDESSSVHQLPWRPARAAWERRQRGGACLGEIEEKEPEGSCRQSTYRKETRDRLQGRAEKQTGRTEENTNASSAETRKQRWQDRKSVV